MGQVCKVCQHSNKIEINQELIQGKSKSGISRKYNVPYGSVDYHSQHHLSRQLATAYEMKELDESNNLLVRIETILSRAEQIFTRNFEKEKDTIALKALSESRGALELMAKIAAHLHQARAAELEQENGPMTFSVTIAPDDENDPMDLASEKLTTSEFESFMYLHDKIHGGDDPGFAPSISTGTTGRYSEVDQSIDPYQGTGHALPVDSEPLESTRKVKKDSISFEPEPEPEPEPERTMTRTKAPEPLVAKVMEPRQIPGPRTPEAADRSRKKSGIAEIMRRGNAPRDRGMGVHFK